MPPSRDRGFFTHPAVGIVGTVASVVGVLLALYFYLAARAAPSVTMYINPVRATVVKSGQASALSVLFNGNRVTSDITAAQVAIWNAGKQPVRSIDVLEAVRITGSVPMLEATLRKKNRDVVTLVLDRSKMASGELGISWNILEQGDGGVVQIIYAGDPSVVLQPRGVIVGQGSVIQQRYGHEILTPLAQYQRARTGSRLAGWVAIFGGVLLMVLIFAMPPRAEFQPRSLVFWLAVGFPLSCVVYGAYELFFTPSGPPFGF